MICSVAMAKFSSLWISKQSSTLLSVATTAITIFRELFTISKCITLCRVVDVKELSLMYSLLCDRRVRGDMVVVLRWF